MTTLQDQPRTQPTSNPFGNQHAQEAEELHQRQMQQQGARDQYGNVDRDQTGDQGSTFTISTDDWFK